MKKVARLAGWLLIATGTAACAADHHNPDGGRTFPPGRIQASDEFTSAILGVQWEWNHNPDDANWSLVEHPGFLRLRATRAADLLAARNTLTQVLLGPQARFTTRLRIGEMRDGQRAGLAMLQVQPNWIGVVQTAGVRRITWSSAGAQLEGPAVPPFLATSVRNLGDGKVETSISDVTSVLLRMTIADEQVSHEFSLDGGRTFSPLGQKVKLQFSGWKGARAALFSFSAADGDSGVADFDWMRVEP